MKYTKALFFAAIFCLQSIVSFAQQEVNSSFQQAMNNVFGPLDKSRVPYGLLRDYAMELVNLENFSGTAVLADSNRADANAFWNVYTTLLTARVSVAATGLLRQNTLDSLWFNHRQPGQIALSGLFFNYSRFRDDAVPNYLTITNNQLIDKFVNGVWQNPYQGERVFLLSPAIDQYKGRSFNVLLPADLWLTNSGASVANISADLGDGLSYRTVTPGMPLPVTYSTGGEKHWYYRLTLTDGTQLYAHSIMNIILSPFDNPEARFGLANPEVIPIAATDPYFGRIATGTMTITYADADRGLRRPLIVAEGFDPGHITSPEQPGGENTFNDFFRSVTGAGGALNGQLFDAGIRQFDVIYVDWDNGTDFIQANAFLLESVIRWVNANKEPLAGGGFASNVVWGQSMGGLVARYALSDMEHRGENHQTRLFVSHDAPQQGANVPLGFQYLARHARDLYVNTGVTAVVTELIQPGGISPLRVLSLANEPAARQMLINYVNDLSVIENSAHNNWQQELRNMGYPHGAGSTPFRMIAISNGSECGTTQSFNAGDNLLTFNGKGNTSFLTDLATVVIGNFAWAAIGAVTNQPGFFLGILPGRNDLMLDFAVNASASAGSNVYRGKITYKKTVLWLIPITVTITNRSFNVSSLPYDTYPGGEYDLVAAGANLQSSQYRDAFIKYNINAFNEPFFCFVPVVSALDIGSGAVSLNGEDYLRSYAGANPPVSPKNSPFANFITAYANGGNTSNEGHISLRLRNANWLAAELSGAPATAPDCSFLCGPLEVSGPEVLCDEPSLYTLNGAPASAAIGWSIVGQATLAPSGSMVTVTKQAPGDVTLTANVFSSACGASRNVSKSIPNGEYIRIAHVEFSSNGLGGNGVLCNHDHDWDDYANTFTIYFDPSRPNVPLDMEYMLLNLSTGASTEFTGMIHNVVDGGTYSLPPSLPVGEYNFEVKLHPNCGEDGAMWWETTTAYADCNAFRSLKINVFPNPASGNLNVQLDEDPKAKVPAGKKGPVSFELYNFDQTHIMRSWKGDNNTKDHQLNIGGIAPGHYILVVKKGDSKESKQIIIK